MANQNDPVVINCRYQDFRVIYRAVTAAIQQAKANDDTTSHGELRNALLRLSEATGVEKADLANPYLWNL